MAAPKQIKKGCQKSYEFLMMCAQEIQKIQNSCSIDRLEDLEKFVEEFASTQESSSKEKNISPERGAKLIAAIESFFYLSGTLPSQNIKSLLECLSSSLYSDIQKTFIQSYKDVIEIVSGSPNRVFLEAKVYFIDDEQRDRIVTIKKNLESIDGTLSDKKRFAFSKIAKFLNEDQPAHKYDVIYKKKYPQILREKSVEYYLDSHYFSMRNQKIKYHNEFLKTHGSKLDALTKQKIIAEHETELKKYEDEYVYIKENFESLDVKIIGYEDGNIYPELKYTLQKQSKYAYLKKNNINILWYIPMPIRSDMKVIDIIKNFNHAFGGVYVTLKNKN